MAYIPETISGNLAAIIDLFIRVSSIKGLSYEEQDVIEFIKHELLDFDVTIEQDDAGNLNGSSSGNLIITPSECDITKPTLMLCAHMDTVRDTSLCKAIVESDRIRSDEKHQLGVDNRLGVAILLHLLKTRKAHFFDANFIVVFTIDEETTMSGATHINLSKFNLQKGIIFDSSKRPGNYVKQCAGMYVFEATFVGKAAHSAVNPEDGVSAIIAAAHAISNMHFGKLEETVTTNIGKISGGNATNVVTPEVQIVGEVRAMNIEKISEILTHYEHEFTHFASQKDAKVSFSAHEDFAPYTLDSHPDVVNFVEKVIRKSGLTPTPLTYTGGSDANVFNNKGIPSVNIGIGAQNPHSDFEFALFEDIENVWNIACNLVRK